jgi:hypothetical protein
MINFGFWIEDGKNPIAFSGNWDFGALSFGT